MRLALAACFAVLSSAAWAGCRLSTAECTVVAREIANEEVARAADEANYNPLGMRELDRRLVLLDRHFARKTAREHRLPTRIANEWARIEKCDAEANLMASTNAIGEPLAPGRKRSPDCP